VVKGKARVSSLGQAPFFMRFSIQEQIIFMKRLGMILRAGMPIMEGLHMLKDESRSRSSNYLFAHLVEVVAHGQPLSTGLSRFEKDFGSFCINIVRVGESSGTLHENLEYLAEELKRKQALRRKVLGSLMYPALIVFATVGIVVMLTVYIFPKILPIFASVKATLPLSTKILIAISGFISSYGWWVLGGIALLVVAFAFGMRAPSFHLLADRVLLRLPIFGKLSQDYNLTNICRTLSLLLKSGAPLVPSLELVAASTSNLSYRREIERARESVLAGQRISEQFKGKTRLFPPMLAQMMVVGESTGNLSSTLDFLSHMYEEEIDEYTKRLTTLLEPVLMIVMGVIVGFIAISIITPIYSITQSLTPR
jgi:type II secretory pathway component PulF